MSEYIYDYTPNKQHAKEEIVRCMDCRFSIAGGFWCVKWSNFENARPKGFCAWGERRVVE